MGINQTHGLGRDRKFFVEAESTAGTFIKATATGAARVIESSIDLQIERKDRIDARGTRSSVDGTERITGKGTISWSCSAYVMPSGTAGTPPDLHMLYYAALGGYTNVPATSDTYAPSDTQTIRTVSITQHWNSIMQEAIAGAWVNAMTISASGGDEPRVSFEGGAMSYAFTGNDTLNGAMAGVSTMVVNNTGNFHTNSTGTGASSVVQIGSDSNSSAGFKVTADASDPSFTIEAVATASNADPVIPFVPSQTLAGAPVAGITGSLKIDSVEYPITAFDVTVSNNIKPLDDEAFQQFPDDVIPGYREVTGNISIRARKDLVREIGRREAFATRDIAVILGSGAGTKCTININQAEIMFAAAQYPEADEGVISLPFKALATTLSAADEIDIAFT